MRIFELTREAVAQPKPLPILPQGVQTPPPATGPGSAEYKQAMKYVSDLDQLGAVGNSPVSPAPTKPAPAANVAKPPPLTNKDVAPKPSPLSGKNPQLQVPATAAAQPAPTKPAPAPAPAAATAKPAAPAASGATNAASLRANMNAAASGKLGTTAPAPAAGDPAAFGGGVVNPPSKSGVVSKADLDNYRRDSGNPTATLGQYMNQQQGKTFRKGGANDPAVIAARQQPAGPPVGSQAQTAGGANEKAKTGIAAGSPALAQPPAAPAAPAPAAPAPNSGSAYTGGVGNATNDPVVVSRNDGVPPPLQAEPVAAPNPNSGSGYAGGVGNVPDFGVRGTPILPYGQGSPVGGTTNAVTRTDAEIGDKGVPGSFDKNAAQGEKNLNALKGLFGGNKQPAAPAAAPAGNAAALIPPANPNPLRGQFAESTGMQDPVLVRMQSLAGIRR